MVSNFDPQPYGDGSNGQTRTLRMHIYNSKLLHTQRYGSKHPLFGEFLAVHVWPSVICETPPALAARPRIESAWSLWLHLAHQNFEFRANPNGIASPLVMWKLDAMQYSQCQCMYMLRINAYYVYIYICEYTYIVHNTHILLCTHTLHTCNCEFSCSSEFWSP